MRKFLLAVVAVACAMVPLEGQRRGPATATLAVVVSDPDGAPVPDVLVTVEGAARRTSRTEGGRIVFEGLPAGNYRLRFERDGFITLERELPARAGAPTDVKVTLTPAPPPPAPPPPPEPERPPVDARPVTVSLLDIIDKEFIGRGPARITPVACAAGATSNLIQLNQPLGQHTHADADEILYVIAGEGTAQYEGVQQRLKAGVYVLIPRGVPHTLTQAGRNPLILLSTLAGEACGIRP